MRRREFLRGATLLPIASSAVASEAVNPVDYVLSQPGSLPILLTAPHGGQLSIPGVGVRNTRDKGKDSDRYNTGRDPETDRIAIGIAKELNRTLGGDPYLVVARFDRLYIDANRPPDIAFDNPICRPVYERYHGMIRMYVDDLRAKFKAAVMIDVHGQHKFPGAMVRGTLNGKSVRNLVARGGFDAVIGPKGMFGLLEKEGFDVFPSNRLPPTDRHEDGGFNGGFTTMQYGSHRPDGIDAFQFEIGRNYRTPFEVDRTISRIARAVAAFHEAYLKRPS